VLHLVAHRAEEDAFGFLAGALRSAFRFGFVGLAGVAALNAGVCLAVVIGCLVHSVCSLCA
jgi:hypothetical protein